MSDNQTLEGWVDMGHAYTWQDLVNQLAQPRPQVFRARAEEVRMRAFAQGVRREWRSMEDYLKHKLFAYDTAVDADGRRTAHRAATAESSDVQIVDNDFPYWFEAGIGHKVMWSETRALSSAEVEERLDAALGADTERVWLLNSVAAQSVRGLWHIHVFIRQRRRPTDDAGCESNESGGVGNAISSTT